MDHIPLDARRHQGGILPTLALLFLLLSASVAADQWADHPLGLAAPPAYAIGFPDRTATFDARPGFATPPPGYGVVAFYWWIGDPLTRERLAWQLDQLAGKGIMGLQINYAHSDVGGNSYGLTIPSDPPLFSEDWWRLVQWFAGEARKRGMAVSLSDYTLAGPGQGRWVDEILSEIPDLHAAVLAPTAWDAVGGREFAVEVPERCIALSAWRVQDGAAVPGSLIDLRSRLVGRRLGWRPDDGRWKVMAVSAPVNLRSIDPIDPRTGPQVAEKFFQRFADRLPGEAGKALNFFFSDELEFGVPCRNLWHGRFADEFRRRKGYDVVGELPALFADVGPRTPKVRLDYNDVMVALEEEAYFRPLLLWHQDRGMIYGCDHGGRGGNVVEFGDYFRTMRWMNGPGNDQPRLGTTVTRTKVQASIAHLYQQPRTWLEGYYGSGWGTTPLNLVGAGIENYCLGSNLQTFHGLYYTTHGGWWEWAPPCNHFRMPYWRHMGTLMTWSQRLCFLLSQGVHRCDAAVLYPVAPVQAGSDGKRAVAEAFAILPQLYERGIDGDFIDDQSLERSTAASGELRVSGERYRVLVLPAASTIHQGTLAAAGRFAAAGGLVIATGLLPGASDRAGRDDAQLDAEVRGLFGLTAAEAARGMAPAAGGRGVYLQDAAGVADLVQARLERDFIPARAGTHVLHRTVGPREVFLVTRAGKGDECFFRASGTVELWDAWTGARSPILAATPVAGGTRVKLPRDATYGLTVVFSPGAQETRLVQNDLDEVTAIADQDGVAVMRGYAAAPGRKTARLERAGAVVALAGTAPVPPAPLPLDGAWDFTLEPTCDNRFGDFRLPASAGCIGAEARRFHYADASAADPGWQEPAFDATRWAETTHGFGPRFWKLGPIPAGAEGEVEALEARLAALTTLDATRPVTVAGRELRWQLYHFSWREGIEGDPGHQGYHGLKGEVSDDFLGLGKSPTVKHPLYRSGYPSYVAEGPAGGGYLLWTAVLAAKAGPVRVLSGDLKPARLWLDGKRQEGATVTLTAGLHPLLASYPQAGRTHLVLQSAEAAAEPARRTPLAMRWYDLPGVLPFVAQPERTRNAGWYRFTAPPALTAMTLAVHGVLQAWVGGRPCTVERTGTQDDGAALYRVTVPEVIPGTATAALRIEQEPGCSAGGAIPAAVALACGTGRLAAGDWSRIDGLASYSGAAWYRRTVALTPERLQGRVTLRLGGVAASAAVQVNGVLAGTVLAPPWEVEVTRLVHSGDNRIEIQVCNTLANHYLTIPTRYRGSPLSGLLGPVSLVTEPEVELKAGSP